MRQAVGLRELRRKGRRLLLNGRALRIAGAGLPMDAEGHGDALTRRRPGPHRRRAAGDRRERRALRSTRCRTSCSSRLDAAGILVWQHIGPFDKAGRFWAQTPQRRALAMAGARSRAAERTAAHPSVLAFNLANEVAGRGHPEGQARYIDTLARTLHRRTPGVFVVADVWGRHPPRRAGGRLFRNLDAVGLTEYIGIFEAAGHAGRRAGGARAQAPAPRARRAARQAARHHGVRRQRQRRATAPTAPAAFATSRGC